MPSSTRATPAGDPVTLLVATRKGAWLLRHGGSRDQGSRGESSAGEGSRDQGSRDEDARDAGDRDAWRCEGPHFLGQIVHHLVLDPRDRTTLVASTSTGHLGPTMFLSADLGRTWRESRRPPAFPKAAAGEAPRAVNHTFWLTPGHPDEPGVWYAGTSPHGLFRSEDGCDTWEPCGGLNDDPRYRDWMGGPQDGTPDGPKLHSVTVDPRDPRHLYLGMSSGGVHESRDGGRSWAPLIDGLEVVGDFDPKEISMHDPHCVRLCPSRPDRLYQQNHCGIYRLDREDGRWVRIGRNMPQDVGDIGFPIVVHPRDADTAWVFPMDGSTVWPRVAIGGRPAAYVTRDGGATWTRQDEGMPASQAWWTVKRQAMTSDAHSPLGLYVGTTSGEIWASRDEGASWRCIARHLPEIYALETAPV